MLEYSIYSVASPEACAHSGALQNAEQAAEALKLDASNLIKLEVIDKVVNEPVGGAHRNHQETYQIVKDFFLNELLALSKISLDDLTAKRYEKFMKIGS